MEDNLSQRALKARRVILDHIHDVGGVLNVTLSKKLLIASGRAHSQYMTYLEDERKLKQSAQKEQLKRKKTEEIETLRKKKKTAESDARHLVMEADQLSLDAQEQRSFSLIARSNKLWLTAKDKQEEVSRLETELTKLQEELNSMKANWKFPLTSTFKNFFFYFTSTQRRVQCSFFFFHCKDPYTQQCVFVKWLLDEILTTPEYFQWPKDVQWAILFSLIIKTHIHNSVFLLTDFWMTQWPSEWNSEWMDTCFYSGK